MKILYLSCHSIAEYDEIKLFLELGHEVFSPGGSYMNPHDPADKKRPAIPEGKYYDWLIQVALQCSKENLHQDLIDWSDIILSHWKPSWIHSNWDNMKGKKVILRTNGQSTGPNEIGLQDKVSKGLKIVRYSPRERLVANYAGEAAMIRFYKDPNEYKNWNGKNKQVISINQSFKRRGKFLNWDTFVHCTSNFPRKVFGPENEDTGMDGGLISYEDLKKELRNNRVYFYVGTQPTCYTLNFIEAWMTGIPIVSIGPKHGNAPFLPGQETFEIQDLIENGKTGFVSDNEDDLKNNIRMLLDDPVLAKNIGKAGRTSAIFYFGKDKIKNDWRIFLDNV